MAPPPRADPSGPARSWQESVDHALSVFKADLAVPDYLSYPVLSEFSGTYRLQAAASAITRRHLAAGLDVMEIQSAYYLMQQALTSNFNAGEPDPALQARAFQLIDNFTKQLTIAIAQTYLEHRTAELEHLVARRTEELRETLRKQDEFVTYMSHEIRTALTTIIGTSDLVLDLDPGLSDETRRYLELIPRSGEVINRLVTDILDYAKLAAGQIALHPCRLNLLETVNDTLALLAAQFESRELTSRVDISLGLPDVNADLIRLQQVLLNLLHNAIKFSPPHSVISIFASRPSEDMVQVSITDQGPGIPLADQERIFERFQQVDNTVSRRQGTGLGLAISRLIVTMHGGHIGVRSVPGEGSTFYFTLPAWREGYGEPHRRPTSKVADVTWIDRSAQADPLSSKPR